MADLMVSVPNVRAAFVRSCLQNLDDSALEALRSEAPNVIKKAGGGIDGDLAVCAMIEKAGAEALLRSHKFALPVLRT
jgi:hypothetical protein